MGATAVAAESIVDALADTDAESEAGRRLSDRAVALLHEAGLTRIVAPQTHGGDELPPRALLEAERVVAHGSPAASWVLMVCAAHTFIAGRMAPEAQAELFDGHPGMLIPGTPSRQGTAMRVPGGYELNGRWPFASGADHGDWVMVGAQGIRDADGKSTPALLVVLPKADVTIDDTWFTLGMRGTGSKDIVLDGVFVPEHRAVPMNTAFLGTVPDVDRPLYRLPIGPSLATMLLGPIVGMSEAGLDRFVAVTRDRVDAYTGGRKAEQAGLQRRVAEARAEIAHAWSLAMQNCDLLEHAMHFEPPMPVEQRAQVRWNAAYAAELCRRAAERLFAGAGAGAAHDRNVNQRTYRDVNTATHHAMLDFDTALEIQGKVLLGVDQVEAMI